MLQNWFLFIRPVRIFRSFGSFNSTYNFFTKNIYKYTYFLSDLPYIASELDIKESLVELMKHINDLHERLGNMIRSKLLWILWLCLELFGVAMAILLDDWPHLIPILAIAVMIHLSHAIYWNYMSRRTETKRRILIEEFNEKCNYNFPAHFYHSQDR